MSTFNELRVRIEFVDNNVPQDHAVSSVKDNDDGYYWVPRPCFHLLVNKDSDKIAAKVFENLNGKYRVELSYYRFGGEYLTLSAAKRAAENAIFGGN